MGAIVQGIDRPAMLVRKIGHAGESGILKTKPHSRGIDMGSNTNDGVHQLIQ